MADTGYKLAALMFRGKPRYIACLKSNKCSALVAVTNLSFLDGNIYVPDRNADADLGVFSSESMAASFVDGIQDVSTDPESSETQLIQLLDGKEEIFTSLTRSLDSPTLLDPKNSSCTEFEETNVRSLFKVLDARVLHGWVLDPHDKDFSYVQGFSHSQMAGKISELAGDYGDDHPIIQKLNRFKNTPITLEGLSMLHKEVEKGKLALLYYSSNEYKVLHNYCGDLFTLEASEEKRMGRSDAVWKRLSIEEDKSFYVTKDFTPSYDQSKVKLDLADEWFKRNMELRHKKASTRTLAKKKEKKISPSECEQVVDLGCTDSNENASKELPPRDRLEECEQAVDLSCADSNENASTELPPRDRFLDFFLNFRDGSNTKNAPHFEGIAKGMVTEGSYKLYIPFEFILKHDEKLAFEIQDNSPGNHDELVKSVCNYLIEIGADVDQAKRHADLVILNLPEPKCNQKFLQFVSENELAVTCKLYDGQEDVTTTPIGRDMALGYLNYIFDRFEEGMCWLDGWIPDEMETRNEGTQFLITKEPNADLNDELGVQNLRLYADTIFPYYKKNDLYPVFFDFFYKVILAFPREQKNSIPWKRFVQFMRSFLGFKAPSVRSTLIWELHRIIEFQWKLRPSLYTSLWKKVNGDDWRNGLEDIEPFLHIYCYRNSVSQQYSGGSQWRNSHWHVLKFSRHFNEHILKYLKTMISLHSTSIVELIVARKFQVYIADAIRIIVLDYGVDGDFSSAWNHFENSKYTLPLQSTHESEILVENSDLAEVKLIVQVSSIKSGDQKPTRAYLELSVPQSDPSSERNNPQLVDLKKFLESESIHVELSDGVTAEDCIAISNILKSGVCMIAVQGPFSEEYTTVSSHISSWLSRFRVDSP